MYKAFNLTNLLFLFVSVVFLSSCEDIFEEELGTEKITLISPANNDTLNSALQTFWWKDLKDEITISNYRVQMVSPSFENVESTLIDTIMTKNKFNYSLVSLTKNRAYAWRVRAENNSSETSYSIASFYLSSEISLETEKVKLTSPNTGDSLNVRTSGVRFEWKKINGATSYQIQIDDQFTIPFGSNENQLEVNKIIVGSEDYYDDYSNLTQNKAYYWRVKAIGETANNFSQWSDVNRVIIKGN